MTTEDPRPLIGEPLALDLINTRWIDADGPQDLLTGVPGLAVWLRSAGLAERCRADAASLRAVRTTRDVLLGATADPAQPSAETVAGLNEVLAHGRVRRELTPGGPREHAETDEPAWLAAWLAAEDYLGLLAEDPTRIHKCANPVCVLRFYDTSQNRRRRWCSMAACGNRAKAARHYARSKAD
jgi:predicted RNA-binding Zn ribbon-like protein